MVSRFGVYANALLRELSSTFCQRYVCDEMKIFDHALICTCLKLSLVYADVNIVAAGACALSCAFVITQLSAMIFQHTRVYGDGKIKENYLEFPDSEGFLEPPLGRGPAGRALDVQIQHFHRHFGFVRLSLLSRKLHDFKLTLIFVCVCVCENYFTSLIYSSKWFSQALVNSIVKKKKEKKKERKRQGHVGTQESGEPFFPALVP